MERRRIDGGCSRKVLIFAREVIPFCNSVGSSIRVVTLADFLISEGFTVKILAAGGERVSAFGLDETLSRLDVEYLDDRLQRYYTRKANQNALAGLGNSRNSLVSNTIAIISRLASKCLPVDAGIFFLQKFICRAGQLIKNENYTTIIVSSPPHSSQIFGFILKRRFGRKIILVVDYRDGWNTFDIFTPTVRLWRYFSKFLERAVLRSADLFTFQSETVLKDVSSKLFSTDYAYSLHKKSLLVRNGYTQSTGESVVTSLATNDDLPGQLSIGYFGGIDFSDGSYRNPVRILREIDALSVPCNFEVYGNVVNGECCPKFRSITVNFNGMVDLHSAQLLMERCDILFVFHSSATGGAEVVPGKFYEYLLAGRPILVYGPRDMECGALVAALGAGVFVPVGFEETHRGVISAFLDRGSHQTYIDSIIAGRAQFSRTVQYRRLLERLKQMHG